ncbi:class D beta-lactamase [Flammeovirga aprica JL-4]|uniref:Beta-lactamase n=2 Tax=Flammeovirga aprica TaxID=29528 RepID=A0A7X9S1P1_9BACT|nr:class D beta-lactamase [Flammeovirga aprica]NME72639.1 class D beta-lactamase [Flammeovirga aprica JL-4]
MYQLLTFLSLILLSISCSNPNEKKNNEGDKSSILEHKNELQQILDSSKVKGAILLYDNKEDTYYSNDFEWSKSGFLPASTFKIPNSIIALETGVVENDSTLMQWDGNPRGLKIWEQDLIFKKAFQYSCVPCYQEVARKIGTERMQSYLEKLDYPGMVFDSTSIDRFWLMGDSRISPFSEIDFLKRIHFSQLPVKESTDFTIKRMLLMEEYEHYKLSGKTGWSNENDHNNGWFVGFLELSNNTIFFATNIEPSEEFDMKDFPKARKAVTIEALKNLNYL